MIRLTEVTSQDVEQIKEWTASDEWHAYLKPSSAESYVTGNGLLSFCIQDDKGPVVFVRFDKDGDLLRVATQFAPVSVVSKRRLIAGIITALVPSIVSVGKENGLKGAVYESVSPTLINFMSKFGFKAAGNDDYVLTFEEQKDV